MKPERWQQLDELFHAALQHEPEERAAFLDEACVDDEALRQQVEALLAANEEAGSFIESPAMEVEARGVAADQGSAETGMASGETISHYRIISPLGSGGMGEVYLTQDTVLGRTVALKLLPASLTQDTDRLRRFEQEARAASGLNHPNIITIYEIGHEGSYHFIAQEYVEGVTLSTYLGNKPLALNEALEIALQVTSALAAAHAKGIVHRDIKPENIMVDKSTHLGRPNQVKVLDFGIAKLADVPGILMKGEATTRLLVKTGEGRVIGTAAYMSPEQARGETVGARTDIWSLGVMLYEMLTGKPAFTGATPQDVIAAILRDDAPPLPSESPEALKWILKKALRKDQEERYQTARELFSDLRDLYTQQQEIQLSRGRGVPPTADAEQVDRMGTATAQERGITTAQAVARPSSSSEYIVGKIKRHRGVAIIVLVTVIIVVAALAFGLYRFNQSQDVRNHERSAVPFPRMKIARLTSTGKATDAAISPDGKYVIHVVDDGEQQSLWMRQVLTSSNVQINPPADLIYLGLTFSPGGNYLYYISWDKKTAYALYQMPVLGGTATKLITDIDSNVTFSPDGKEFAFLRGYPLQGETAVMVANADGTSERKLAPGKLAFGPFGNPAWSPNGKVIAYPAEITDANGNFMTLSEVQVADGSEKPISSQRWWRIGRLAWLRDGSGLVFTARESVASPSQIWYLAYPGGEAHRITNDLNNYLAMSLTADSSVLVTVQSEQVSNVWIAPNDDARRAIQVTHTKFDGVEGISWTPDGKIVYASGTSGNLDLWLIEANGTGQKQLTANAGNNSRPSVSDDGRYVVFMSDRTGTNHIWRIDIDGSNATELTNGGGELNPQCLPIGQSVLYGITSGKGGIGKVAIGGGENEQIIYKNALGVAISPDGKWIASAYFQPTDVKTAIYPIEGGEPQRILDLSGYNYIRWTPDGRALAYVDQKDLSNINSQLIDGGPSKQLTNFKSDLIFSFAWSRDGKQLALARGTLNKDVVLISNFKDQQ